MSAATTTSGKSKTAGKVQPSRSTPHVTPANQHANGTVMTKPNTSANLVKSGTAPTAAVQPKLTVGKPNDSFEQQADAMAQKVVSMTPADVQQVSASKQTIRRQINPTTGNGPARTPLQKKETPGSFMLQKAVEKEKVSKKLQKTEELKKKGEEKLQKTEELKKKSDEKLQKKAEPEKIQKAPVQAKAEVDNEKKKTEKLQLKAEVENEKKKTDTEKASDKVQKKAEPEKIQKASKPGIFASAEKLLAKILPKPIQLKEEDKLQKTEELKKKAEEKPQKKAEPEKIQKAPEPKIAAKETVQAKPVTVQAKPVQLKEEEKLRKSEELKKKAEEKPQKKAEPEKIQKASEQKVLASKETIQPKPAAVQAKPVQLKEEEKLRKTEEVQKKGTEEKVQKKAEAEKIQKADANAVLPKVQLTAATTATIQSKEEEKLRKAADEKLQKAADEKIQKAADEKLQKAADVNVQKTGDAAGEKIMKMPEGGESDQLSPEFEAKLQGTLASGTPMNRVLLAYMESRFDADFSQVRFHMDATAVQMCNEIGARAFAYKNHVYFNRGQYQPDTDSGRFLIAHELTHVIQQGYATQKGGKENAPAQLAPKTEEKVQSTSQTISSSSPRIQRLGWDTVNNAVRRVVPIWTLLTVIMGYNPILGESVARSPINWFQAMLDLIPIIGPSIFDKLRESGMIARAEAWFNSVFAELPSMGEIRATWDRCWSEMGILEGIDGNIAIFRRHFSPIFGRITTFVSRVMSKIVEILRETLLRPLNNVVKDIPGWDLICTLIGSNPLTGEAKPRTALNVIRGVAAFIPGGQEKVDQLVQSGAIEKAYQWFITETTARNLTWARIQATFTQAWDSLRAEDILHPIDTFRRLAGIFSPLLSDLAGFALAALIKLLEFIYEAVMGAGGARVLAIVKRTQSTFLTIIRNPVGFLGNLLSAVGMGIRNFGTNILRHLQTGVITWLTGTLARGGVEIPRVWDLAGILKLVMSILGLTWPRIREIAVRVFGPTVVTVLETTAGLVMDIREKGFVQTMRDRISEIFGNVREMILGRIKSFIQQRIVMAGIQWIASMLSPVGAVIQAIIKTYETVMFFIQKINEIMEFVNSVLNSVESIANGALGPAAAYVEQTMARTIPLILDFLARLLGLGDVGGMVRGIIQQVQTFIAQKVEQAFVAVRGMAQRLIAVGSNAVQRVLQWWRTRKQFTARDGVAHTLYFEGEGASVRLIMATTPTQIETYLLAKRGLYTRLSASTTAAIAADATRKLGFITRADGIVARLQVITRATVNPTQAALVTTEINSLSELMMEIATDTTTVPLPTPAVPSFGGGGRKFSQVDKLSTATSTGGEAASDPSSPNGWARIKANKLTDANRGQYVRMHMISAAYGGKNSNNNLIPAPHAVNTGSQVLSFENAVKRLVENPDGITHKPNVLWVKTQVTGFHAADRTNPNTMHRYTGSDYPSGVTMEAGLYFNIPEAPFWRKDNAARVSETITIGPPDYTKAGKVAIYVDGEPAIQEATGCSFVFAREICLAKLKGQPTSIAQFRALMEDHWDNTLKVRRGVPFNDNLTLVIAALNANTITYH
jgi:hypothetical protein